MDCTKDKIENPVPGIFTEDRSDCSSDNRGTYSSSDGEFVPNAIGFLIWKYYNEILQLAIFITGMCVFLWYKD